MCGSQSADTIKMNFRSQAPPVRPATDRAQAAARQADRHGQAASHPVRWTSDGRRPDRVRACLPDGVRGHRLKADGCALSERAIDGVAQVEEPSQRGGAAGERGGLALTDCGINVSGRSVAAADTSAQSASGHCPAQTRRSYHQQLFVSAAAGKQTY